MTPEQKQIAKLNQQVKELTEALDYLTRKLYEKKTEQMDPSQLSLLEDEGESAFIEPEQTGQGNQVDQVQPMVTQEEQTTQENAKDNIVRDWSKRNWSAVMLTLLIGIPVGLSVIVIFGVIMEAESRPGIGSLIPQLSDLALMLLVLPGVFLFSSLTHEGKVSIFFKYGGLIVLIGLNLFSFLRGTVDMLSVFAMLAMASRQVW